MHSSTNWALFFFLLLPSFLSFKWSGSSRCAATNKSWNARGETGKKGEKFHCDVFSVFFFLLFIYLFFLYVVIYSNLLFEWQRREKMERRQAVVETELKLCKYGQNADALLLTFGCPNSKTHAHLCYSFYRGSSQRPKRTRRRFQDLIRGSNCEFLDLYLT